MKAAALAGVAFPSFESACAAPSGGDAINHAAFGCGGMGEADIKALLRAGGVNLVAVADVDTDSAAWIRESHPGTMVYRDWRELLAKEAHRLDSVSVTTPDHMHAPIGVSAMKRGLHVYGQKPLAHNLYEARRMAEIARETGVVTQMGVQLTSSVNERLTVQMVRDGVVGKIKEVHMFSHKTWGDNAPRPDRVDPVPAELDWDLWCGVAPKPGYIGEEYYHRSNWRRRVDYGCGTLGDMGCHIFGSMFRALGSQAPLSVTSLGDGASEHNWGINEKYEYVFPGSDITEKSTTKVTWHGGSHLLPEAFREQFGRFTPKQGAVFVGTEGVLLQPHKRRPIAFPREKFSGYEFPELEPRDHYADFIRAVRGEEVAPLAGFVEYGGPLTEAILLGGLSSRFPGQMLEWDAAGLRVTNLDAANRYVRRAYREGWEVDGL